MAKHLEAADVFEKELALVRLVSDLQKVYPPLNPGPGDTMEQIMYRAGQRSVVEYLENLIED